MHACTDGCARQSYAKESRGFAMVLHGAKVEAMLPQTEEPQRLRSLKREAGLAAVALSAMAIVTMYMGRHHSSAHLKGSIEKGSIDHVNGLTEGHETPSCPSARPPLVGFSISRWSSKHDYLEDAIESFWDANSGNFSWNAPLQKNGGAETGIGYWLTTPQYHIDDRTDEWTSTAFVATRVKSANRTSCCCQYMSGNNTEFRVTEYCRARVMGLSRSIWETCAEYSIEACPADNATASKRHWSVPAYSEVYSACMKPMSSSTIGEILQKNGVWV
eukprot:TRINITY_DN14244_c0_g1_i3.p1 TRINITY_DN14244_c0_g1~~TRINITY_DN14244_c0_g1_i3.p1  ORF type:complete len:274 (+),score=34.81 TRINITY_DN14244_c0_g1_i3:160-981(+)